MKNLTLLLFLNFFIFGCINQETTKFKEILHSLGELNNDVPNRYYLIIPIDGCNKCVEKSVSFSKKYLNKKNISFILTSQIGGNIFNERYSKSELVSSNLYKDEKGLLSQKGFTYGYVTIIHFGKYNISESKTIEPNEVEKELANLERNISVDTFGK